MGLDKKLSQLRDCPLPTRWLAPPNRNHNVGSNIKENLLCIRHQARRYVRSLTHARVVLYLHANLRTLITCQVVENCTLHTLFSTSKKLAGLVKPMRDLNLEAWENELENDFDKTFLLHGSEFGFDIVNKENLPVGILANNHLSALPGS